MTLVLENVTPRTEIQLLHCRHPDPLPDPQIRNLTKLGMISLDSVENCLQRRGEV